MSPRQEITDNLEQLLNVLPPRIRERVEKLENLHELLEIVLDLGRQPEARFPGKFIYLSEESVTREDVEFLVKRVGEFGNDNRAGIERTLHRISAIRNRAGDIIGLTCRIGRAVFGTIDIIRDVVESGKNVLLLGRPGVGKTTMLREIARVLSDQFEKRVVVVDTSNEIAGDGDIPHPGIGHSRRMQVVTPDRQAAVMIEAVENHMPEVIVIDEIGTEAEAGAARTIAERGVQLIGTAHGNTLDNLVMNPTLSDLIGGIQAVTLGDDEARKRGTQKTVLERKAPPTFDVVIEIQEKDRLAIHHDVAKTIDFLLRGFEPRPEVRVRREEGKIEVIQKPDIEELGWNGHRLGEERRLGQNNHRFDLRPEAFQAPGELRPLRLYPYAVSRNRLEQAISETGTPVQVAGDLGAADAILTLKGQYRKMPKLLREAERRGIPIHIIRSNTITQMETFLENTFVQGKSQEDYAILEAERAARHVLAGSQPVELRAQNSYIRRLQHEFAEKYNLKSKSIGQEPNRRVIFYTEPTTPD